MSDLCRSKEQDRIVWLKNKIADLHAGLKYADHGAWTQDKDRIRQYQDELRSLLNKQCEVAA